MFGLSSALKAKYYTTPSIIPYRSQGFLTCVSVAASLDLPLTRPSHKESGEGPEGTDIEALDSFSGAEDDHLRLTLLSSILGTLTRSFEGNDLNRHIFSTTIGFRALIDAIKLSSFCNSDNADGANDKLFGVLLAFLLDPVQERSAKELLVNLRQLRNVNQSESGGSQSDLSKEEIDNFLRYPARIMNPEAAIMILTFIRESEEIKHDSFLRSTTMLFLSRLAKQSRKNTVLLAKAGLLDLLLQWLFPLAEDTSVEIGKGKQRASREKANGGCDLDEQERRILTELAQSMLLLGVETQNIRHMVERVIIKPSLKKSGSDTGETLHMPMLRFMREGLRASRWPPFFHFDLSNNPYAAISLPNLANRQFPPFNNNGYTFLAWIHIDRFPEASDRPNDSALDVTSPASLDILNIKDDKEQCTIRLYIDFASRTLAIKTGQQSITHFPNAYFEERRWYHLAMVHHRGSRSVPSCASVFLDGKKVDDRILCAWPSQPEKGATISASLGLPRQLAKSSGYLSRNNQDCGIWSLGPTWLLDLELHEEMIYVSSTLGPRYISNFQDRLGQYQTYLSSTRLNLHIENVYGGSKHAGHSPLVKAIRAKAAALVPENRIYFALQAGNVIRAGEASSHPLTAGLAVAERVSIDALTEHKGRIVFNSAVPDISTALQSPSLGIAKFEGEIISGSPKSMDDAFDKVGGVPLLCKLVELAKDSEELALAINVWEESFRSSWKMSEDAERSQAYEIVSML